MADDISEKPNFESLLRTDFRWPTEGDAPFTQSEDWEQNAYIDRIGHGRIGMMMNGYKIAGDLMVAQVARDRHDGDVLVFPVVFNYRRGFVRPHHRRHHHARQRSLYPRHVRQFAERLVLRT